MKNLTQQHIDYEKACRQMFVGQKIRAVIYGELKYFADENGNNVAPEPYYKTAYADIDTLDYSIYFKTDHKTIHVFWDNTFFCYGLQSKQLDLTETTNVHEQKWDVTTESKWTDIIGQTITDCKIRWEEVWTSNVDAPQKVAYPQTIEINTENEKTIIISAAEFIGGEICYFMDNLLITTNGSHFNLIKLNHQQ